MAEKLFSNRFWQTCFQNIFGRDSSFQSFGRECLFRDSLIEIFGIDFSSMISWHILSLQIVLWNMLFFQVYLVENFHLRISLLRFSGKYFLTFFLEISFEIFVGTEQKHLV